MKVRAFSILSLLLLMLAMVAVHCDCDDATVRPCVTDDDCKSGECCRNERCTTDCGIDGGCPTIECTRDEQCADLGPCMQCRDRCCTSYACESDADCPETVDGPRYCGAFDDAVGCRHCEYVRCEADADCKDPSFPFYVPCSGDDLGKCINGQCRCRPPCGGACPDGQYCCWQTQTCDPIPIVCYGVECPPCEEINPDPGGSLNAETCRIDGADCFCRPRPPLDDAFAGRHSAIDLGANGIPVFSGYYGQPYGDLLFGEASSAETGATVEWTIIDGLPEQAECVGAADGPRGGIAEPGDDVGWDTGIAVDSLGRPHISYFDRTNGDLKYAVRRLDGTWLIQAIDSAGTTGRFSSIALDTAERPLIAYMTTRDAMKSYVKVARANQVNPMVPSDWDLIVVDEAPVPCLPADCAAGSACLEDSGTCETQDDPVNCEDRDGHQCPDGEVCVAANCEKEMRASSLEVLPPGVGLFVNLALYADDSPAVGYYDNTNGNLKFAWYLPGAGIFSPPVILAGEDGSGNDLGNLGSDVSMHIVVPDETVHISFQDVDLGDLYYLAFSGQDTQNAVMELVDVGARDANGDPADRAGAAGALHWVGNFATIRVDSWGCPRVVYQDGTSLDMLYAMRDAAGVWNVEIIARKLAAENFDGAWGFFTDQVMNPAGDMAVISNFKHNLRTDPWTSGIDIRTK